VTQFPPIAIVGRACLLPGASSPEELWAAVDAGDNLISSAPTGRWGVAPDDIMCAGPDDSADRTWSDRGGYVAGFAELFDPEGFRLPAEQINDLDPVFQWTFHTARQALRDAGHSESDPTRSGAVFGNLSFPSAAMAAFTQATSIAAVPGFGDDALEAAGVRPPDALNRFNSGLPALLLERALGLGAGAFALDAACASSLYAIKLACDRLHDGTADLMLAGAVNCADDLCIHMGFAALTALSRSGTSRPFHADADGLVPAEGCGFVALRRLDDAEREGDMIHGVIRGIGLSNDGRGRGMLVPSSDGQARAIADAFEMSGLAPTDISLLECHATGTQVGDATEIQSSAAVYEGCADVPIGSLKSNMGHLITTAGVAGLIKVIEAMRHEARPPTLHAEVPLELIADSPFRLLDRGEQWDRTTTSDGVLRAGVSAFGFGGNNAHLIVEEPGSAATQSARNQRLDAPPRDPPTPVAIVGIGITAASAAGRDAFVEALLSETPCLDDAGEGKMSGISLLAKNQKFPPNDLAKTLAQQLAMLAVTDEAIADSGPLPAGSTGVYVGMGTDPEAARFGTRWRIAALAEEWNCTREWIVDARDAIGPVLDAPSVLGTMPNIVANRLNSQYDMAGPSFTVSSEERSGIDAIELAARALRAGEIDAALVGAVDLSCESVHRLAVSRCLPADRRVPGDAAVMLVLKRLDEAEQDGNTVYAVLPGGRFEEGGGQVAHRPDLRLGLAEGAARVEHLFGHAHAASGLVHVAAATISLHYRVSPGDVPLLASNPGSGGGLAAGVGPRTAAVEVDAMEGIIRKSILLAEATNHVAPSRIVAPRLHIFSGHTTAEVLANLDRGQESDDGPARLAIVADSDEQFAARVDRARRHIEGGHPPGEGVHFRAAPLVGEMAFVFTAAGTSYHGMGTQLLQAIPEIATPIAEKFPIGEVAGWVFGGEDYRPTPSDYLWGASLLSRSHAQLTRQLLKLRPSAAIGYSSGESSSLYAFGVWSDVDAMRGAIEASGLMEHELGVEFNAVARAWGVDSADWAVWNVLAPPDEVRAAVADEARVHLTIINTARDVVIGGDPDGCARVVERVGRRRCLPMAYNLACHTPEVAAAFHQPWVDIHTRAVTPFPGVRHYSNGTNGAYDVGEASCAAAITAQAESMIDFPATIEAAYADGVRIFVEHGPAGACTSFVKEILCDRDILAVQLDRRGKNIEQIFEVAAALAVAGVDVDHQALSERLDRRPSPPARVDGPQLTFPAHPAPVDLPPLPVHGAHQQYQVMAPAPALPPVFGNAAAPVALAASGSSDPMISNDPMVELAATIQQQMATMTALHDDFVKQQAAIHEQFLLMRSRTLEQIPLHDPALDDPVVHDPVLDDPVLEAPVATAAAPTVAPGSSAIEVFQPSGPVWNREQLKIHSSGKISELFGPLFVPQDSARIQCRMPEPPLLLADRVTGLVAPPGVLGEGTIWTETDVEPDAWYLNSGYMPAGFMIESGQADLMLISYMGIDLVNDGERAYRLLGCTLTYHGDLPAGGESLQYEIRINGHAKHGDIRLFFFEYDCIVAGQRRLTVRDAQAGFFNSDELGEALGVLWTPEDALATLSTDARVDPPDIVCAKSSFSTEDVIAFSEGRVLDCFGPGYEWTETHTRTPKIQAGDQLFIDEVTNFDPSGGPWGRGFMRCETAVADDDWFFDGHFKNDPCMPGNFMVEACIEALSFYLAALGYTTRRDGWRFQPLPDQPFELKCRGEINPRTDRVAYEVHVEEVWSGPNPTVICDVVGFVDGRPAFHAHRIGVELTPGWPLTSMPEVYRDVREPVAVATDRDGFPFDWKAMISCAWGKPSEAFGSMYEIFDGTRRPPRLPGEPYHFISRIVSIDGDLDNCRAGMEIVCEYDIPDDAWYFDENGAATMPFAVLLEAALQPCGWVASAVGSATGTDDDMLFRNLDGTGTIHDELTRTAGTLSTHIKLKSVSRAGGMLIESFDVECSLGDRVVYTMDTVFGFFPPQAFEDQVGLAITDDQREQIDLVAPPMVDLTCRPERFCGGPARLAEPMLLMLDRAVHIAGAGIGLGVVRGEKDVDVSEWFFKAHFFQDPVQPGSLGIEALLQLLQFYMLDTNMAAGIAAPRFEPLMLARPMTWKYRGQVTPKNEMITSVMEITETGTDDDGPYVIGNGSLWCDGLRIYEVANMGMRILPGAVDSEGPPVSRGAAANSPGTEVPTEEVHDATRSFWNPRRGTPPGWLGDDLIEGLVDRYVNRVMLASPDVLDRLRGRPAIFLANHQVQMESLIISNLLPALTGVSMTTVANAKHRHRWIGEVVDAFNAYPGCRAIEQIAYFDQAQPATMFDLIDNVKAAMAAGSHSFFVHTDGTRSRSCRERTTQCSSVFLDLAFALNVPIVPVRFTGGLPVEPIDGKAELPVGHGRQDYWIGEPIEADALRKMMLRDRVNHVVAAINKLGVSNEQEVPLPGDPAFAALVDVWQERSGSNEVFAAAWQILEEAEGPGEEAAILRAAAVAGTYQSDGTSRGDWLGRVAALFFGPDGPDVVAANRESATLTNRGDNDCSSMSVVVHQSTHPQLIDHVIKDVPVVPVAYALEWFARSAAAHAPGLYLAELSDLKVIKGITAGKYLSGGNLEIVVSARTVEASADGTIVDLELVDEMTRKLHYSCSATLTAAAPLAPEADPVSHPDPLPRPDLASQGDALPSRAVYDRGVLFHGPAFQVIVSAPAISATGLTASVTGVIDRDWPSEPWISDPAMVDGALQLALLWTENLLGGPSLPTGIRQVQVFRQPAAGSVVATLTGTNKTKNKVICDVVLRDGHDETVAQLIGIETHRLPGSPPS